MNIRMSTKGKRPLRSLTPSDKIHAIQRIHDGESKASVARDIGVPESTLRGWCKNEDKLRFMSRQSVADKMAADSIADKLECGVGLLSGPPDKRRKLDSALPLNFSNKMKYDELTYKPSPLSGLDYSTNKALSDLNFNGLNSDYATFNGTPKNKVFGADVTRQADPSMAAISPLSSLSHLSGLTGLSQSPLAMSFNELTSNLSLLAQLNPSLAAMSSLNGLASTANNLRSVKSKVQQQMQSPRNDSGDRQQGLTVKNWAKQKNTTSSTSTTSSDNNYGLNLTQNDPKNKMKCPSPSLAPSLGGNFPPLPAIPDDPLLYWLKSQQAMLGLNNLYPHPPPPFAAASPPIRSSTPQQTCHTAMTPPIASTPLTPSSTPSGSLDDKNSAWFNWCKAFGASLNSLGPAAVGIHSNAMPMATTAENASILSATNQKASFENILYSQLTKDADSPSMESSLSVDLHNQEAMINVDPVGKPEDLSAKSAKSRSPTHSPLPTPAQSPLPSSSESPLPSSSKSPIARSAASNEPSTHNPIGNSVADCKDVLENLLYKINSNANASVGGTATPNSIDGENESDESYSSENNHNNNDLSANNNNNNNNSNKTDEEERAKCMIDLDEDGAEAIKHGEKFLKWLENCSNPRVTTVQLMQLRFLITAIKSENNTKSVVPECNTTTASTEVEGEETVEECQRGKMRRRK